MKRSFMKHTLGLAGVACLAAGSYAASAQIVTELVRPDGSYPTVPLEKDVVVVKVVQNEPQLLQNAPSIKEGLEENIRRMGYWVNKACTEGKKPDFILFNEFPLTGYSQGTREEKLKFTITVPGPETEAIGKMAKDCDTYIIFGSYATDPDWPGHILSLNPVIGRDGEIKHTYWKTRNASRYTNDGGEIPTTTIENVRDKFRAKYGIENEFPVLQTEFGNIAVSTVQIDPFVFAAFAMRGVEIMLRTATGFSEVDVQAIAYYNNVYSAMSNITFPSDPNFPPGFGGNSLIVAPGGKILAQEVGDQEAIIEADINIAELRKDRRVPRYPLDVVKPVFDQFQQEMPLNHLDVPRDQLPQTRQDMKKLMDQKSKWLNLQGDAG
ncbi:MAG: carbon-nitrogen hydrolase family protein [Rhodospirillaceae bacterium]|jgi:predicted amidohydrolase|nr:carbon-nitrogen hydrolase family protein [Rhodospirillaceae bacterium]